jgi:hypothetical protein
MSKKLCYLSFGHLARMSLVVEQNEPPNPIDIGLFGPNAKMFTPDDVPDLVEQFWFVLTRGRA